VLSVPHVIAALEAKGEAFGRYELGSARERAFYEEALAWLAMQSASALTEALAGAPRPGALPTGERVAGRSVVLPFGALWENHTQARAWALETLRGVTTLAVDGSQIPASPDFSMPVGAVQVGWFENPHDPSERYVKDIHFEVLPPEELGGGEGESADAGAASGFPDRLVNARRFELECQVLVQRMRRAAEEGRRPVCFLDGSLIISFAAHLSPELQRRYVGAVRQLLDTSERARVPVVGYVDTSQASDLVHLLGLLRGSPREAAISDNVLLSGRMAWGDRTEAWVCARNDGLFDRLPPEADYYARVVFLYLKTTSMNPPARLDVPRWVLEAGELDRVLDIVRAECVVATGYPYALETADALAVITLEDRERFYRLFQEYLSDKLGLELRYSRKAFSKRGRR